MLRRVLALSCCGVFVDTALYAALTPLLPHFVHEFHLSKRGAAAALAGRQAGFASFAGLGVVLAVWARRVEGAAAEELSFSALGRALRTSRFLGGLGLMVLPSLLFGALAVLAPLHLAEVG